MLKLNKKEIFFKLTFKDSLKLKNIRKILKIHILLVLKLQKINLLL